MLANKMLAQKSQMRFQEGFNYEKNLQSTSSANTRSY